MKKLAAGIMHGWLWAVGSLFLGRVLFRDSVGLSLPWVLGAVLGLGARIPGGLVTACAASLILDSWSLRPLGIGMLILIFARWVVAYCHQLFELTGLGGQALSLSLALAMARALALGFEVLLSNHGLWLEPRALVLSWMIQVGIGLLLMHGLPAEKRLSMETPQR